MPETGAALRQLYMVLSPRAWVYARLALRSLFEHCDETFHLHLVTDSAADKLALAEAVSELRCPSRHRWTISAEDELADAEASLFRSFPRLRAFRHGHPCWRKITDPLLLGTPGSELILLDPDVFFPNRFRFEATPQDGLLLMWQKPNCLLPPHVVRAAMDEGIPLARHVDIGVSHWRAGADLEWLEWLIGRLGGASLPRQMHVEAIIWSAIAMRVGGGYLDPSLWRCWHRTQAKRVRRRLGATGAGLLASEPWGRIKCFHAGGEAKWWLAEAGGKDELRAPAQAWLESGRVLPFVELTRKRYEREQSAKGLLGGLGYYRLFAGATP